MRRLRIASGALSITLIALAAAAPVAAQEGDFATWSSVARALMLPDEIELLDRVTTTAQAREFIARFWQRRDPDRTTTINEFKRLFDDRLGYADKEFAEDGRRGTLTPRGQIYMILGSPDRSGHTARRYKVDGALKSVEVWEYQDRVRRGRTLRFVFAHTREGVKFVVQNPALGLPVELVEGLNAARAAMVTDAAVTATESLPTLAGTPLPLQGTVVASGRGALAMIELDVHQLMGEPASNGIVYRLQLQTVRPGEARPLGSLMLPLTIDTLRDWSTHPVRIAIWLPEADDVLALRVVEGLSGRSVQLPVLAEGKLPAPQPVARYVAVADTADDGVIYAWFGPSGPRPEVVAHVVTFESGSLSLTTPPAPERNFGLMLLPLAARE